MKPRMLCTDCGNLAHADTVLPGSDTLEMLGWLCLGLPGWLYCCWRHALRIKVCASCGSGALVREARAAAAGRPVQLPGPTRIENLDGPVRWPPALRSPRERLRHGFIAVALWGFLFASWILGSAGVLPAAALAAARPAVVLVGTAWLALEAVRTLRIHAAHSACRAWDHRGRPLHVELL
jgi:hypothetical protein